MVIFLAQYGDAIGVAGIAHVQQLAFDPVGRNIRSTIRYLRREVIEIGQYGLPLDFRLSARQMQRAILAAHGMRQLALPK